MEQTIIPEETSTCSTCGSGNVSARPISPINNYVYAIGKIDPQFPRISVEKEFAQLTKAVKSQGMSDRQVFHKLINDPANLYIVRQLCWVFSVADVETYLVVPRHNTDLHLLIATFREDTRTLAIDSVIGEKGQLAPPDFCNGLSLPIVFFDQLYSFDKESLLKSLLEAVPDAKDPDVNFSKIADEVLQKVLLMTDNTGLSAEHRAINYLSLRYPGLYKKVADCYNRNLSLTSVETRRWKLAATRAVVEVLLTFTHRKDDFIEKYSIRVDVNDEFPYLASKIAPYYEH